MHKIKDGSVRAVSNLGGLADFTKIRHFSKC